MKPNTECPLVSGEPAQFFRIELLHHQPETILTDPITPEAAAKTPSPLIICSVCSNPSATLISRPPTCPISPTP